MIRNKIYLLLFTILFITTVNAWTTSTFNNSVTEENLNFYSNSNITRYLPVSVYSITNAFLNLSGYNSTQTSSLAFNDEFTTSVSPNSTYYNNSGAFAWNVNEVNVSNTVYNGDALTYKTGFNLSNYYSVEFETRIKVSGGCAGFGTDNWAVGFTNRSSGFYGGYSSENKGLIMYKYSPSTSYAINRHGGSTTSLYIGDNDATTYTVFKIIARTSSVEYYVDGTLKANLTTNIPSSMDLYPAVYFSNCGAGSPAWGYIDYFKLTSYQNSSNPPSNVTLYVGNTQKWYFNNAFNQENNRTTNLASTINTYLSTCTFIDSICYVPIIFHSDSLGVVKYSDLTFNNVGNLNLTFSTPTNITITSTDEGYSYTNNGSIFMIQSELGEGIVVINYGDNQIYSYDNDLYTDIEEYLYVDTTDLNQKIKVLESGIGIKDVLVKVYKEVSGEKRVVSSAYTDGNGQAIVTIDDGYTYTITAEKDNYETASEIIYIPESNTETVIINIESTETEYGVTSFISNCKNKVKDPTNCWFRVKTDREVENITIYVSLSNISSEVKSCSNETICTTNEYTVDNEIIPVNATLYLDGNLVYPIIVIRYEDITSRGIQINFPTSTIKSSSTYLTLFYFMTLIMGLFIAVSVNKKMNGWGLLAFIVWLIIIAQAGFWEYWLVITPLIIIQIAKLYYGWIK